MSPDTYLDQLAALLPPGLAWPRDPASTLMQLMAAWADEYARLHSAGDLLFAEAAPDTATMLFGEWLRMAGVPDVCASGETGNAALRAQLLRRLTLIHNPTPAFYIDLAAAYGFAITLTEFEPTTFAEFLDTPLLGVEAAHRWQVNLPLVGGESRMTFADPLDTPLSSYASNLSIECLFGRLKPAHTHVTYSYT